MDKPKNPLPPFEVPSESRHRNMSAIKSVDTKPELYVRRSLHAAGFRFRLHRRDLPGCPDIVLPRYHIAILVQGCFWHGHSCRRGSRVPKTNSNYWREKIARNVERDRRSIAALIAAGWLPVIIWECSLNEETSRLIETLDIQRKDAAAS